MTNFYFVIHKNLPCLPDLYLSGRLGVTSPNLLQERHYPIKRKLRYCPVAHFFPIALTIVRWFDPIDEPLQQKRPSFSPTVVFDTKTNGHNRKYRHLGRIILHLPVRFLVASAVQNVLLGSLSSLCRTYHYT